MMLIQEFVRDFTEAMLMKQTTHVHSHVTACHTIFDDVICNGCRLAAMPTMQQPSSALSQPELGVPELKPGLASHAGSGGPGNPPFTSTYPGGLPLLPGQIPSQACNLL